MGQTQFRSDDTVKWWLGFGDGSDGDYSSAGNATDAPIDSSCSGSATFTSLSATNASFAAGKPVLIHQTRGTGAGNWELNQISSYTSGTITLKKALQNTYTDSGASQAQVIQLKQYKSFTQGSGHTLTAKAWDGNVGGIIAFLAKGTVTITGTLTLTGKGFIGGTAGPRSGNLGERGDSGESYNGPGVNASKSANAGGGGGSDNWQYDVGTTSGAGGGGYGTSGANGNNSAYKPARTGGTGGSSYGNTSLTQLHFGSSGGGGAATDNTGGSNGANGSSILSIFAKNIIITGSIISTGGIASNTSNEAGAGGGGAGGSVLLKCVTATLGTNKILATGGSGGNNTGGNNADGGTGGVGRIHLDYSGSYTGTTSPTLDATLDPTIKAGGAGFFAFF